MKKLLYGTTALVTGAALMSAPVAAEEGIKLGLGGYMNNYFGVLMDHDGEDDTDYNETGLFSDGEVWFKGETTLDNGITFGANIQLESFGDTGDTIDEDFGYMSGSFGRVNFGSENTAMYLMQYTAPYVGAPINSGWLSTFIPADGASRAGIFRLPGGSTRVDIGNDENQITYFTPRFSGFQVGASYAPTANFSGDGKNFPSVYGDKDLEFTNGFTVGANFVESFNGIDVAVAGGYGRAEGPDDIAGVSIDDMELFSVGANIGFSGFTVGGSYAHEDDDILDGEAWDIGATYTTGPWSIGGQYFSSDVDVAPSGADFNQETQAIVGGVGYAVGPGISTSASVIWGDYETDVGDTDGIAGIVGITYSF